MAPHEDKQSAGQAAVPRCALILITRKPKTENRKPGAGAPMKAAILAAGLGTRLRPLTELVPKPLMPVLNRPLLGLLLAQLEAAGCFQVAVNTHHLAAQVQEFLAGRALGLPAQRQPGTGAVGHRRRPEAVGGDSAGRAVSGGERRYLDRPGPGRGLSRPPGGGRHHPGAPRLPALQQGLGGGRRGGEYRGRPAGGPAGPPLAYTGVQVVDPRMLEYLPPAGQPYDLVTAWRQALAAGERLAALMVSGHFWQDLGTPAAYLAVHRRLLAGARPWPGIWRRSVSRV